MAYEVVIYMEPKDADKIIEIFFDDGPETAIEELRLYHWQGHHQIIRDDELTFRSDDIVFGDDKSPYLGWINPENYEAGLFYKLPH